MSWLSEAWNSLTGRKDAEEAAAAALRQQQQQATQQQKLLQDQLAAARADDERRAQEAQAAEARKREIQSGGAGSIDQVFSKFDEPYYQNYAKTYFGAQTPDLEHQYDLAKDKLTAQLAGRGVLNSTVGASQLGELDLTNRRARERIASEAQDAANQLRGKVSASKSKLYEDVYGGAAPNDIASRAATDATTLANIGAQPTQSLGDLFGALFKPTAAAVTAGINAPKKTNLFGSAPLTGAGSSTIVT